jgi:hypothetical protein
MAYLTHLIAIPLTLCAILFALSNGGDVTVGFWPSERTWILPLNLFGLALVGAGFFCGALFVWLQYQRLRYRYWQESRKAARLEKELEALHRKDQGPAETIASALATK